jgi:phosphate acetyltransferase
MPNSIVATGEHLEPVRTILARASRFDRTIVFPDAEDERTLKAVRALSERRIVRPVLVGDSGRIQALAEQVSVRLEGILVVDPQTSEHRNDFVATFHRLRSEKGLTMADAERQMLHPLWFGAMMVRSGKAHGSVAGALSTTSDVLKAGLQVVGLAENVSLASSYFLMAIGGRVYSFADCGVVPDPSAPQLAEIAVLTADNHRRLTGEEPYVAMLSFSTLGSASHARVEKVRQATALVRVKRPDITVDGELQVDAALDPGVAGRKAPGSSVAGRANVLIFPDLDSGNIGYKIAQRMGGAEAIGPIVQGLERPCFDLSRGCTAGDIITIAAINVVTGDA